MLRARQAGRKVAPMSKAQYIVDHLTKDQINAGIAHVASMGAVLMVLAKVLPVIAAIMPILWYSIVIFESKTVQAWVKSRAAKKRRMHLAAARAARLKRAHATTAADLKERERDYPRHQQSRA